MKLLYKEPTIEYFDFGGEDVGIDSGEVTDPFEAQVLFSVESNNKEHFDAIIKD